MPALHAASVSDLLMKSCGKQILFWFYFFFISGVYCVTISFIGFSFSSDSSLLLQGRDQNSASQLQSLLFTFHLIFFFSMKSSYFEVSPLSSLLSPQLNIRNQTKKLNIIPASPFMGVSSLVFLFLFARSEIRAGARVNVDILAQSISFLSETGNFCCL